MKPTIRHMMFAVAVLLFGVAGGGSLEAQTTSTVAREGRPALAAPIRVVGAQTRKVPSSFMRKLAKGEESQPVEVLDLAVEVSSRALDAFAPSLQPRLHIGGKSYPGQRAEHSNWDARNEKPIDPELAVGETQTLHFFIEEWQRVEPGQVMFLTVLTPQEIQKETDGQLSPEAVNRVLPELKQQIPLYAPREFMTLDQ